MSKFLENKRRALMGGNDWLLADGMTWDDVVVAYLFTARADLDRRLMNIAPGPAYPLTLSGASLTDEGLVVSAGNSRGANNADVNTQKILSGIMAINSSPSGMMMLCWPKGTNNFGLHAGAARSGVDNDHPDVEVRQSDNKNGMLGTSNYTFTYDARVGSGIIGGTVGSRKIYLNGGSHDTSSKSGLGYGKCAGNPMTIGVRWNGNIMGDNENGAPFTCKAAVFYSKALDDQQHASIAAKMRARVGM